MSFSDENGKDKNKWLSLGMISVSTKTLDWIPLENTLIHCLIDLPTLKEQINFQLTLAKAFPKSTNSRGLLFGLFRLLDYPFLFHLLSYLIQLQFKMAFKFTGIKCSFFSRSFFFIVSLLIYHTVSKTSRSSFWYC